MSAAVVFGFLFTAAAAFDPITSSKWIESIGRGYHCHCVNLIFDHEFLTTARIVSKILSLSFHSCRVLSPNVYLNQEVPYDCPTSLNVVQDDKTLSQISFLNNKQEEWLVIVNATSSAEELFKGIDISFDSSLTLVRPVPNSTNLISFEDVYRVRKDYSLNIREMHRIDVDHGGVEFFKKPNRINLEGILLVAGTNIVNPHSYRKQLTTVTGETDFIETGYFIDVFRVVSELLNFKFTSKWFDMPLGTYTNDDWTGIAKSLYDDEIDVILGAFNMNPFRMNLADYPGSLLVSSFQVFTAPIWQSSSIFTLLKPFEPEVWGMVALWLANITVCLFLSLQLRKKFGLVTSPMPTGFSESLYFTTQALCQQAYSFVPRGASLRIIIFVAFLTANTLIPAYSGSLISSLTQRQEKPPFRTLEQLSKMDIKVMVGDSSEDLVFFKTSENPVIQSLAAKNVVIMNYSHFGRLEEAFYDAMRKVCENQKILALFGDESYIDYNSKRRDIGGCKLIKMEETQPKIHQSFALKKNNPYISAFRLGLMLIRERGILSRFKLKYWHEESRIIRKFESVHLTEVSPIFLLFAVGTTISFLIFFIEHFVNWSMRKNTVSVVRRRHLQRFDYYNQLML